MKLREVALCCALTIAASVAAAQTANADPAVALARAMRLDEIAANDVEAHIVQGKKKLPEGTRLPCLESMKTADFTAGMAKYLKTQLTAEQIDAALKFYSTSTGGKLVVVGAYNRLGLPKQEQPFNEADWVVLEAFSKSPIYKTLDDRAYFIDQKSFRDAIIEIGTKFITDCTL